MKSQITIKKQLTRLKRIVEKHGTDTPIGMRAYEVWHALWWAIENGFAWSPAEELEASYPWPCSGGMSAGKLFTSGGDFKNRGHGLLR